MYLFCTDYGIVSFTCHSVTHFRVALTQVSPSEVVVRVDKQHLAGTEPTLSHKQRASFGVKYTNAGANKHVLKEGSAAAGFKKKKGVLTVKIQYL